MKSKFARVLHLCVGVAFVFFGTAYFFFDKEWAKIPAVVLLAVIGFVSMATFKRKGKKE